MIKVLIEVGKYATRLTVAVFAESIIEAVSTAKEAYPGKEIRVVFPIDSEEFFVGDASAAQLLEFDRPAEDCRRWSSLPPSAEKQERSPYVRS